MKVEIKCLSGSVAVFSSRDATGTLLDEGESDVFSVADVTTTREEIDTADWVKKNLASAWNNVGVGKNGREFGQAAVTPTDCGMVIREYLQVDHFMNPDAEDHRDHKVMMGETIVADMISSNVVTLIPMAPL
jgi:hypothetical protein